MNYIPTFEYATRLSAKPNFVLMLAFFFNSKLFFGTLYGISWLMLIVKSHKILGLQFCLEKGREYSCIACIVLELLGI